MSRGFVAPERVRLRTTLAGRWILPVATLGLVAGWIGGAGTSSLFTVSAFAVLGLAALCARFHLGGVRVRWPGGWVTRVVDPRAATLELENVGWSSAVALRVHQGTYTSPKVRPGAVLPLLARKQRETLAVRTSFPTRGHLTHVSLELVSSFPFGLFEAIATFRPPADVLVLPRTGEVRGLERVLPRRVHRRRDQRRRAAEPGDESFDRVRELRDGESLRRVHWGLSARADRWIRRVYVAEGWGAVDLVLVPRVARLGLRRDRDVGFETAVSLVATLARALVAEGASVRFRVAGRTPAPVVGPRGLRRLGVELAELVHVAGDPWEVAAGVRAAKGRRSVVVLAGGGEGERFPGRTSDGGVVLDADHPRLASVYRSHVQEAAP